MLFLVVAELVLEQVAVDVEHDMAVHLDEAAIGIVGEALVGAGRDHFDGLVVEAEVEDRVHHAGHRGAGAGAHRNQKRVLLVAEGVADELAHLGDGFLDLLLQIVRVLAVVRIEIGADLGGDGEAGRNRQAEVGHLVEVGALAAEKVPHFCVAVGLAAAEGINPFSHEKTRSLRWELSLWLATNHRVVGGALTQVNGFRAAPAREGRKPGELPSGAHAEAEAGRRALPEDLAAEAEERRRPPARLRGGLPGRLDQGGALDQAAEVLLVQMAAGDRLHRALQLGQGEGRRPSARTPPDGISAWPAAARSRSPGCGGGRSAWARRSRRATARSKTRPPVAFGLEHQPGLVE